MYTFPNSVAAHVKGRTHAELTADATLVPFLPNLYPLSGQNLQLNRRTLNRHLGEGAFGSVNLEVANHGSRVATKYTKPVASSADWASVVPEIAILKYVKGQPNVAQYVDIVTTAVNGTPLADPGIVIAPAQDSLSNSALFNYSWDAMYKIIKGVLLGVYVLHSHGIIHRDLKPANMLLTKYKEVWISDFGSSVFRTSTMVPDDGVAGSLYTMSPETLLKSELQDEINRLDPLSFRTPSEDVLLARLKSTLTYTHDGWKANDAWALGISLIEIICGGLPPHVGGVGPMQKLLNRIFQVTGVPVKSDGEVYILKELYETMKPTFMPRASNPNGYVDFVQYNRPMVSFTPVQQDQFTRVKTIIKGLLTYDPSRRLTMEGALHLLEGTPPPTLAPMPPLYAGCLNYVFPPSITDDEFNTLFIKIVREVHTLAILDKSIWIVLMDRILWYLICSLHTWRADPTLTVPEMDYMHPAMVLTGFDICAPGIYPGPVSPHFQIYINRMIKDTIPFLSKTILDELVEENNVKDQLMKNTLGYLNIICFIRHFYRRYHDRITDLKECMFQIAPQVHAQGQTFLATGAYEPGESENVTKIVDELNNSMSVSPLVLELATERFDPALRTLATNTTTPSGKYMAMKHNVCDALANVLRVHGETVEVCVLTSTVLANISSHPSAKLAILTADLIPLLATAISRFGVARCGKAHEVLDKLGYTDQGTVKRGFLGRMWNMCTSGSCMGQPTVRRRRAHKKRTMRRR